MRDQKDIVELIEKQEVDKVREKIGYEERLGKSMDHALDHSRMDRNDNLNRSELLPSKINSLDETVVKER